MFNGSSEDSQHLQHTQLPQQSMSIEEMRRHAYVRIVEEPASKALRFRYECEGRSAGSIPGASSTPENKTFPSIEIVGYTGRAVVVVSCVTKDPRYKPHPHNLVAREGCKKGIYTRTVNISPATKSVTFSNLGIQCIKKKDIDAALRVREELRVDPFSTGFSHRNQSIDLTVVRLCFQVFLERERGKFRVPLRPVVSQPIYDKKAMSDLVIVKMSHCVSYVDGGREDVILLCEKVSKEDIQIRFFEKKDGQIIWEGLGDFQPSSVHKQTAIWFRTPRYKTLDVTEPVKVFIQLRRPSDGAESEALPFELLPLDSEPGVRRKRKKLEYPNEVIEKLNASPARDGGQIYGNGLGPMYFPNPGVSPHQQCTTPVQYNLPYGSTPSLSTNARPPANNMLQQNWNIMSMSGNLAPPGNDAGGLAGGNTDGCSALGSLLDLDSQELRQIDVNSGDLARLNIFDDINNLSDNFNVNLSLTDVNGRQDQKTTGQSNRLFNYVSQQHN